MRSAAARAAGAVPQRDLVSDDDGVPGNRGRARVAWTVALLAPVGVLVVLALAGSVSAGGISGVMLPGALLMSLAFAAVALLVLRQQPGNRIAWLFLVVGSGIPVSMALIHGGTAMLAASVPGGVWVLLAGVVLGEVAWPLLWLTPHFFPDGRPAPGRFWSVLAWASVAVATAAALLIGFDPAGLYGWNDEVVADNPLGLAALAEAWGPVSAAVGLFMQVGIMAGGASSLVWRWWRSGPDERRQLAAFVFALPLCLVSLVVAVHADQPAVELVLVTAAMVGLPAALGVAVLRYRLYELDRVLSRAVSYSVLTTVLLALYVLSVTVATRVLPVSSTTGTVLATLACAAAFQPLRRRLQERVDARFNPSRARARAEVDDFARRLQAEMTPAEITEDLAAVAARVAGGPLVLVWLPQHGSGGSAR